MDGSDELDERSGDKWPEAAGFRDTAELVDRPGQRHRTSGSLLEKLL